MNKKIYRRPTLKVAEFSGTELLQSTSTHIKSYGGASVHSLDYEQNDGGSDSGDEAL